MNLTVRRGGGRTFHGLSHVPGSRRELPACHSLVRVDELVQEATDPALDIEVATAGRSGLVSNTSSINNGWAGTVCVFLTEGARRRRRPANAHSSATQLPCAHLTRLLRRLAGIVIIHPHPGHVNGGTIIRGNSGGPGIRHCFDTRDPTRITPWAVICPRPFAARLRHHANVGAVRQRGNETAVRSREDGRGLVRRVGATAEVTQCGGRSPSRMCRRLEDTISRSDVVDTSVAALDSTRGAAAGRQTSAPARRRRRGSDDRVGHLVRRVTVPVHRATSLCEALVPTVAPLAEHHPLEPDFDEQSKPLPVRAFRDGSVTRRRRDHSGV